MSDIITVTHKDRTFSGKWSGKNPIPNIGDRVGVRFSDTVPAVVEGYWQETEWIGILVKPTRLPIELEKFGLVPTADEVRKEGFSAFRNFYQKPNAFCAGIYGAETSEDPDKDPKADKHGVEEEFAVLLAAATYGRNTWRTQLSDSYMNGNYNVHDYYFLCGELQRVRNFGSWEYIDTVVKRNKAYVETIRNVLQNRRR